MDQNIDLIDLKILNALQRNARLSYIELANEVGLSKTPCLNRVKRLEKNGVIARYSALINAKPLDLDYVVFVEVKLERTTQDVLNRFNAAVHAVDAIQSCYMVSGGFDYLLKIRSKDMQAYTELMINTISTLPGIASTSTYPAMVEVKDQPDLPIPDLPVRE